MARRTQPCRFSGHGQWHAALQGRLLFTFPQGIFRLKLWLLEVHAKAEQCSGLMELFWVHQIIGTLEVLVILFSQVVRVSIYYGTIDARRAGSWACRRTGKSCPVGAGVPQDIIHMYSYTFIASIYRCLINSVVICYKFTSQLRLVNYPHARIRV